jgi:5'-nucleotidase (lipoprotein e(P4) family)
MAAPCCSSFGKFCPKLACFAIADSTGCYNPRMKFRYLLLVTLAFLHACAGTPSEPDPGRDGGLLWVKHSAEYRAMTEQVYAKATSDLPGFVEDTAWSVIPGQDDAAQLPVAVILDVDETVVSNIDFQLTFERPFENWKLDEWTRNTVATPIHGVKEFVESARAAGVTVFFVTNRPCELREGISDPCPQKQTTIEDIAEVGIETDADHVFLSDERGWNREKSTRRKHIAQTHRVVMLIGDDLGDFLPCVRKKPYAPCTTSASAADRMKMVEDNRHLWGNGWYILPNPMHGSWTPALPR